MLEQVKLRKIIAKQTSRGYRTSYLYVKAFAGIKQQQSMGRKRRLSRRQVNVSTAVRFTNGYTYPPLKISFG